MSIQLITHKLDNQSLLSWGNTATHDRFALRCKVQEQTLELRPEGKTQRLPINDDRERSLGPRNETSVPRIYRRGAKDRSDLVATGFNLGLSSVESIRLDDHNVHIALEKVATEACKTSPSINALCRG